MHKRRRWFVSWTRRSAGGNTLMLQLRPESDVLYPFRLQVQRRLVSRSASHNRIVGFT